jgi:hypothetical protein
MAPGTTVPGAMRASRLDAPTTRGGDPRLSAGHRQRPRSSRPCTPGERRGPGRRRLVAGVRLCERGVEPAYALPLPLRGPGPSTDLSPIGFRGVGRTVARTASCQAMVGERSGCIRISCSVRMRCALQRAVRRSANVSAEAQQNTRLQLLPPQLAQSDSESTPGMTPDARAERA